MIRFIQRERRTCPERAKKSDKDVEKKEGKGRLGGSSLGVLSVTFFFLVIYYDGETKFTRHGREKRERRGRKKREGREGEGGGREERREERSRSRWSSHTYTHTHTHTHTHIDILFFIFFVSSGLWTLSLTFFL